VVFTASSQSYAEAVVAMLNRENTYITQIYSRTDCTAVGQFYVKDLDLLGEELTKIVLLDDSLISFAFHLDNGVLIEPWSGDAKDFTLLRIIPFLKELAMTGDIREFLRERLGISGNFQD
jgi:Dullard-like phosphatase family protein